MKLAAPWITFYHEMEAMFGGDPEIRVELDDSDEDEMIIKLYVDNQTKAEALEKLLPMEKKFGNVSVYIEVIPSNEEDSKVRLFQKAFENNPAFKFIYSVDGVGLFPANYVVFENKVVQFFNDELNDIHGNKSTLYQEIAKDIFENHEGIYFCTDTKEEIGKPLGEWP